MIWEEQGESTKGFFKPRDYIRDIRKYNELRGKVKEKKECYEQRGTGTSLCMN
jgi:hypothetical protein